MYLYQCASVGAITNVFNTTDARCKHEDYQCCCKWRVVAVPCSALTMMLHTEGHCRDFELIPSSLKIKYTTGRFESTLLSLSDGTKSLRRNS